MKTKFNKYLNGTCTPEEYSAVVESLCANNNKVSVELLSLWVETLNAEVESRTNNQLLEKIHQRIALEESKVVSRRVILYRNLLRVAAVLILALISSTIVFYNKPASQIYSSIIEKVSTPYAARTNFKLPDGSEVWLNSGSTISFPKEFGDQRKVELVGQAFFKVVKDGKPFKVKTNYGSVEVMGTSFDVKAYQNENFETTLVEGSVKIKNRSNIEAILKPGQQSIINSNAEMSINDVDAELITSWKDGKLIFVNEPFRNVVKTLERWYNFKIELKGENLLDLGYTGTVEMETLSEIIELVNITTPINYRFNNTTRTLKIERKDNNVKRN